MVSYGQFQHLWSAIDLANCVDFVWKALTPLGEAQMNCLKLLTWPFHSYAGLTPRVNYMVIPIGEVLFLIQFYSTTMSKSGLPTDYYCLSKKNYVSLGQLCQDVVLCLCLCLFQ